MKQMVLRGDMTDICAVSWEVGGEPRPPRGVGQVGEPCPPRGHGQGSHTSSIFSREIKKDGFLYDIVFSKISY